MNGGSQTRTHRVHPLLHDACCCRAGAVCLACRRWLRQFRTVLHRRQAWRMQR
jgi:hypothetical protein